MKLITQEIQNQLLENGKAQRESGEELDHFPVVKFFTPDGAATWLITEASPDQPDILFGLCDLGMGFPELGSVSLGELQSVRGKLGLPIERDRFFSPDKTLSGYFKEALKEQRIIA